MADIPGKGAGLVSKRALKMDELILDERPLFVCARGMSVAVPPTFTPAQVGQYQLQKLEEYCEIAINRMRPEAKTAFMALWNCHKEDGSGPIMGICKCFQYGAMRRLIFFYRPSCSPNTAPRFHMRSFSYRLYAVRNIAAGEELTFQYTDVKSSTEKRQAALKPYDFVCACTTCKDTTKVSCEDPRSTSDWRRSVLTGFYAARKEQFKSPSVDEKLLDECCMMIELILREGLEHLPMYFDVVRLLMQGCVANGDAPGAREWAARLEKCYWDENRDTEEVMELLKSGPAYRKHPLWRTLVEPGVPGRPLNMTRMLEQSTA
ncbi:Aldehyde dehydrogenase [Mycena sanguinolenta]|uniref:Aldehyde dehydrogenase n=1 Tax=Mycena sanguinolenta TaxID=230812 RepID=A0A8H7CWT8_9AGAR|nr:Aldehyde dehydrogenase [Mycena sanguinolenta]